jgi:hypothetical protein
MLTRNGLSARERLSDTVNEALEHVRKARRIRTCGSWSRISVNSHRNRSVDAPGRRTLGEPANSVQFPILRGIRARGTKPRVVAFQGWCVSGFGARAGAEAGASGDRTGTSAAALARSALAARSSFSRQQCLYLRPEPQVHGSLRPGRALGEAVIVTVYRHDNRRWKSQGFRFHSRG